MLIHQRVAYKAPWTSKNKENNFIVHTRQETLYHGSRSLKQESECQSRENKYTGSMVYFLKMLATKTNLVAQSRDI